MFVDNDVHTLGEAGLSGPGTRLFASLLKKYATIFPQ
jgi:hypothetical protein